MSCCTSPAGGGRKPGDVSRMSPRLVGAFGGLNVPLRRRVTLDNVTMSTIVSSMSIGAAFGRALLRGKVVFYSFDRTIHRRPSLIGGCLNSIIKPQSGFFTTLGSTMFDSKSFMCVPGKIHYPVRLSACFHVGTTGANRFRHALVITSSSDCISCLRKYATPVQSRGRLRTTVIRVIIRSHTRIGCSAMRG